MKHIMIDIETLSTTARAAILSIGAVAFDPDKGGWKQIFHSQISIASNLLLDREISEDTLRWWRTIPNTEVMKETFSGTESLRDVISNFGTWILEQDDDPIVWGNGSDFDITILSDAFNQLNLQTPWKFWNVRCLRTLKNAAELHDYQTVVDEIAKIEPNESKHNALKDAIHQTNKAIIYWQSLIKK